MGDEQRVAPRALERAAESIHPARVHDPSARRERQRSTPRRTCAHQHLRSAMRVAVAAEPGDDRRRDGRDHRGVTPLLTGGRVRQVQLHDRTLEGGERVLQRAAVVREGTGVDHDGGAAAARAVHGVDQLALVVRLEVLEHEIVRLRHGPGRRHVILEGAGAVDLRFALPEQVEVGAAEQQHDSTHVISSRAARASGSATPGTTSTPAGPSSTNVSPPMAFLSRPMSDTS